MTLQSIRVLVIGDDTQTAITNALASVIPAVNMMVAQTPADALGMYALFQPDVVLVNAESHAAAHVQPHLGTLATADTPDTLVILGADEAWVALPYVIMRQLPATYRATDLITALHDMLRERGQLGKCA
jgi:hypothetical protein